MPAGNPQAAPLPEQGPPDPMGMIMQLIEGALMKWDQSEAIQMTEQDALIQTLMGIVQAGPPAGPGDLAPGAGAAPAGPPPPGMMPPPMGM